MTGGVPPWNRPTVRFTLDPVRAATPAFRESMMTATAEQFSVRHRETLDRAVEAIRERAFWTPYPEIPKAYGEEAATAGKTAYEGYLNRPFPLAQPGTDELVGAEKSPYGVELGVTYPHPDLDVLLPGDASRRCRSGATPAPRCGRRVLHRGAGPAERAHPRDRARRAPHLRPGVRHGVPGRRPARAGPRAGGGRLRLRRADRAGRGAPSGRSRRGRSPRCRWPRSSRPSRAASAWSSAATPSRPGTATRACSPRWPPATRWSSSRTRTRSCRWRSR